MRKRAGKGFIRLSQNQDQKDPKKERTGKTPSGLLIQDFLPDGPLAAYASNEALLKSGLSGRSFKIIQTLKRLIPMFKQISLRARIIILLIALVLTTIGGGLATIWYAETTGSLFTSILDRDILSFQVAEEMETALVMQKGFTTYYFQDGNPDWLKQLETYQKTFEEKLKKAREYARMETAWGVLGKIESEYLHYKSSPAGSHSSLSKRGGGIGA